MLRNFGLLMLVLASNDLVWASTAIRDYEPIGITQGGDRILETVFDAGQARKIYEGLKLDESLDDPATTMCLAAEEENGCMKISEKRIEGAARVNCLRFHYPSLLTKANRDSFNEIWTKEFKSIPEQDAFLCVVATRYRSSQFKKRAEEYLRVGGAKFLPAD
ncbi:MAG TPA: hypothetical protein PLH57_05920 [Oligoflexia bacterium]|nr:hypothetical protein [Oligoflexia bacterium]